MSAYRRGLYPFAHIAPLKWWSPPERSVLSLMNCTLQTSAPANTTRQLHVTFDRDFEGVIAQLWWTPRRPLALTWITPRLMYAYADLFDAGYAHLLRSLE